MSAKEERIIDDLVSIIKSSYERITKPYDTSAIVRRVDTEKGIAYVHIPGGIDETPVKLTINAKEGDEVQVRVANGSAFLLGNASAPPTDDSTAKRAETDALRANKAANNAESSAKVAAEAASKAVADVTELEGNVSALNTRVTDAESEITTVEGNITNLQGRVTDAEEDIDDTLAGLALAQNVIGTLQWITAHSTVTTDTTPQAGTTYYIKHQDGTFEVVTDTTGKNPAQEGWYVMDESVQNYIASHIALTQEGLVVTKDNTKWKVLIKDDGVYIIDNTSGLNEIVAKYKDTIQIGKDGSYRLEMQSNAITLYGKTIGGGTYSYQRLTSDGTVFGTQDFGTNYAYNIITGKGFNTRVYSRVPFQNQEILKYFQSARLENGKLIISKDRGVYPASTEQYYVETASLGDGFLDIQGADDTGNKNGIRLWFSGTDMDGDGLVIEALSGLSLFEVVQGFDSDDNAYGLINVGLNDNYSVDSDLRQAVIDKGWDSDVINVDSLDIKALLEKLTASGGGKQQVWYGTSNTGASTARKEVTTTTGDFNFTAGNVLYVRFRYANETYGNMKVTVDGTTKDLYFANSQSATDYWSAYETLALVYNGVAFYAVNQGKATTSYYGMTKLEDSVTSTSTTTSATPNSVKTVMDAIPEIDKGRTGSISCNANNYKDATVTFDTAFSAIPNVVVSIYSTSTAGAIGSLTASALDVTTTGFKVRVFNAGSASRSPAVDWIAIN